MDGLKTVPNAYRPMPFWSWNGKLEREELLRQIADMQEKGFGGFVIHARAGLVTPYMGDEWFSCVQICIQEAKKRGMYVWLYDENGWPSGFAGGKLLSRKDFLVSSVRYTRSYEWDENATATFIIKKENAERVFQPISHSEYVHIYTYKNPSYVDLCNPEVSDAFIAETHEKYYEAFSSYFGNTVRGFFTDEPQWFRSDTPYSDQLVGYFQEHYGENVTDKLPLLFFDLKGAKEFRYRYYSALNLMIRDNFFRKIYDWCERHGCMLTGHGIDERSFFGQMVCSGNVMPFYEYMQQPGMDFLGRQSSSTRIAKQVYSVAKQTGRKRVFTETFAMTGWDVTFEELRWIIDSQFVGGANSVCPHLYPYAFENSTRYDHPCMFSDCDPWWEKFGAFNEYCSRLSYLLTESEEKADIAVLHTVKSAFMDWKRNQENCIYKEENGIDCILKTLFSFGIPFDIVDESMLGKSGVEKGKLLVGKCTYSALILPYCTALNAKTAALINKFVEAGGKLYIQYPCDICIDGGEKSVFFSSNVTLERLIYDCDTALSTPSEWLAVTRRKMLSGREFAFIVNKDKNQARQVGIRIRGMKTATTLDVLSLEKRPVMVENETAYMEIEAASSIVLLINEGLVVTQHASAEKRLVKEITPSYEFPTENFYISEDAEWSFDGKNYEEKRNVRQIQKELLKKRHNGKIYLRHKFNFGDIPSKFSVSLGYTAELLMVNGRSVKLNAEKSCFTAEIQAYLTTGENEIIVVTDFYQRPYVYDVLFGEGTTESLLNCLRYDTELTELSFTGDFAVNAEKVECVGATYRADGFVIERLCGDKKRNGNTIENGLPFYRGKLTYHVETDGEEGEYEIELCGRFATAEISLNGESPKDLVFSKKIPVFLQKGKNVLAITVYSGNRNAFGPFHLLAEDSLVSPDLFSGTRGEYSDKDIDAKHFYFAPFGLNKIKIYSRKLYADS